MGASDILRKVIDLHQKESEILYSFGRAASIRNYCASCGTPYPCPTIKTISSAIQEEGLSNGIKNLEGLESNH